MSGENIKRKWQLTRGKNRAHWGILTLDDLPKTNWKYSQLITLHKARYQAANELGEDKPKKKTQDFSI
jgi:hypothetical protein